MTIALVIVAAAVLTALPALFWHRARPAARPLPFVPSGRPRRVDLAALDAADDDDDDLDPGATCFETSGHAIRGIGNTIR